MTGSPPDLLHLLASRDAKAGLAKAVLRLSDRYRVGIGDQAALRDDLDREAYLTTRMPATAAAIATCLADLPEKRRQGWTSLLDLGAGPGTTLWAVRDWCPTILHATLVERDTGLIRLGQGLLEGISGPDLTWLTADLRHPPQVEAADLVTVAYAANELPEEDRDRLIAWAWSRCSDTLLLIEPGTPEGARNLAKARPSLIALGGVLLGPCTHQGPCPLAPPDGDRFCRFSVRVARSRQHRLAKGGQLGHEDEPFAWLAIGRTGETRGGGRVMDHPHADQGGVDLSLCSSSGLERQRVLRRDGRYRSAKRLTWGDHFGPAGG